VSFVSFHLSREQGGELSVALKFAKWLNGLERLREIFFAFLRSGGRRSPVFQVIYLNFIV
jgi:hypothetical protein